ncbi:MAG: MATE family efflux transporter, partial [Planctomycetota bacterium]
MSAKNGREALPSPASKDGEIDALSRVPAGRAVLRTGLPLAVAMASHALINLVDLALVGRLGKGAAAAAHVASVVNFVPMIVGNSISVAAMAVLSQWIGSGDRERAREFARRSLWFMLVCGTAVSVATALPAAPCIDSIGSEGAVRTDAIHYLVVSNLGCLPMFLLMQTTAIMRAAGETVAPLVVLLAANLLNLVLDVVLLFGWDAVGIDAIGVVGAAYATVAARTVAALLSLWWLFRVRHRFSLSGVEPRRTRMPVAVPLLRGAWPQVVQIGLRAALAWLLTALVQRRSGDDGTAALSVTTRLDTLVLFSALGFASAATTIAGRAVARGEVARARSVGWHAGIQALLFGGTIVFVFQHFAEPLLRL